MRFLLDTCVVSELTKPKPDPELVRWFGSQSADDLLLSAITIGEIRRGAMQLAPGKAASCADGLDQPAQ